MANPAVNIDEDRSPVKRGQILEGKFRVERIIGEGAMGMVVEATHLELEERVALKFLREEAKGRPEIVARFAKEARSSVKIKNDHVARVYDVGAHDGIPFIVMEFLHGQDLEQVLEAKGPMDPTTAVEYVIQACEGLTAAHVQGVVHRDIKPGNLFLTEHGGIRDVKVLDFGISKAGVKKNTLEDVDLLTGDTTQIMGSPHYMSPEQIRSTKDVDARADIWSLGVVLYELIANAPPFDGGEVTSLIAQVLHEPHRTLRSIVADVPTGLEEVIDHCLQKDPAKRYQSAAELAVALLTFAPKRSRTVAERAMTMMQRATGQQVTFDSLPPPAPSSNGSSAPISMTRSTGSGTQSGLPAFVPSRVPKAEPAPEKRSLTPWIALVAIVLGLGGGAFALFSRLSEPKPTPEPAPTTATKDPTPPAPVKEPVKEVTPVAVPSAPPSETAKAAAAPVAQPIAQPVAAPIRQQPAFVGAAPRPKPSTPTAPTNAESEIRHER